MGKVWKLVRKLASLIPKLLGRSVATETHGACLPSGESAWVGFQAFVCRRRTNDATTLLHLRNARC